MATREQHSRQYIAKTAASFGSIFQIRPKTRLDTGGSIGRHESPFPKEEEEYFAAARRVSADLADVATIMISQGPRPDEVMSLRQDHVDLFNRRFTIWDTSSDGKSGNAHRTLKMTDQTFTVLARRLSTPGLWAFHRPRTRGREQPCKNHNNMPLEVARITTGTTKGAAVLSVVYTTCAALSQLDLHSQVDRCLCWPEFWGTLTSVC